MPLRTRFPVTLLAVISLTTPAAAQKKAFAAAVDARSDEAWKIASDIWAWAEPGYGETKSSAALAAYLEKAGFKVERGVAGIPTAFTATFGSGTPVVGILGEYDALPDISQDAVPVRQPRAAGNGNGHACGHHLFGVASATAAVAVAEQLKAGTIKGTVRFYGCPAEEGGAAKVFMARDGLFKDCDVCLHWHPASRNTAGEQACLARIAAKFRFRGTPSHAASAPEKGRSALDALVLTMHAVELLREHTPDGTRLHHTVTAGGGAANVVPEFAEGFFYVRHPNAEVVKQLYARVLKCAQAGALATETRLEVEYLGGTMELVPNNTLAAVAKANLAALNDLKYTPEEAAFAARIQDTLADKPPLDDVTRVYDPPVGKGFGSTDVGDVSWVVPTGGFGTSCWVPGTPGHTWQATAAGGTSIGRKGMLLAAKVMAANAWDLYADPKLVAAAKAEFARRTAGTAYAPMLEKGQPPPLNYRTPAVKGVSRAE